MYTEIIEDKDLESTKQEISIYINKKRVTEILKQYLGDKADEIAAITPEGNMEYDDECSFDFHLGVDSTLFFDINSKEIEIETVDEDGEYIDEMFDMASELSYYLEDFYHREETCDLTKIERPQIFTKT